MQERTGIITFKGNPMTLVGPALKVGDTAPTYHLVANDLSEHKLCCTKGKTRIISVVPSLDTGVCDIQTRRFNQEAGQLADDVVVLTVSKDLPFAQKRWCGAANATNIKTVSDYKTGDFGTNYGLLIKELGLLTRAVLVIDAEDKIQYIEIVPEVTKEPNYEAALDKVRAMA